ncbi:invasin domain 3-containing protein [Cohnella boryungensis]|uniref:Intimin n=1 Tax=Cohnella boryungensis TaxID=768479 RepID=A0ABV8S547_9BACL
MAGNAHTSILRADGSVWSVGSNFSNALGGNRTETEIRKLAQLTFGTLSKTTWTADTARTTKAGDPIQVSLQLADSAGTALDIGTDRVQMEANNGVVRTVTYANEGKFVATFESERVGVSEIAATINGLRVLTKLTVQVAPGAPSASASSFYAAPTSVTADGTSSSILTLEIKDAWGNAMSSSVPNVSLTATRGILEPLTELASGKYEARLTSTEAGKSTVSVVINGVPLGLTTEVNFLSSDPDAANSVLELEPDSLPADGESKAEIVLHLYDKFGNALTQSGGDVIFATDLGEIGSVTETVYGVYSTHITSITPGKATVTAMRDGLLLGKQVEVSFVPVVSRIVFDKNRYEAVVGTSVATTVTAHYWNGETKDVTADSAYSVSDSSVATISGNGLVSGHKAGEVTLTARFGGSETTVPVVVVSNTGGGEGPGTDPGTGPGTSPGTNVKPDPTDTNPKPDKPVPKPDPEQPGSGTKQPVTYADVAGHWAEAYINRALIDGWASGYANNSFQPNQEITRAEFVKLIVKALGYTDRDEDTTVSFKDDKDIGAWARQSIALAVKHKLISGFGDGSFRPNALISRVELTSVIVRALGLTQAADSPTKFADDKEIPAWARPFVVLASDLGIVQGRKANLFVPNGTATRAEAIVLIQRMLERK